jgi:acetylornithine deacetylase/succinyl-diaminopimelate desuccinylase-like protein
VFDAIRAHLEQRCPAGFALAITRHGRGSAAAALPPDLPALEIVEDVLEGLYGVRPLRVAMGATIPIGGAFRRILGIETVFFSFATADEDYHGPNEFFRLQSFRTGLVAWARVLEAIGARLGGTMVCGGSIDSSGRRSCI